MPIIPRTLKRWLRRPTEPPVLDRMPGLSRRQLDAIRRHDATRRAYRTQP